MSLALLITPRRHRHHRADPHGHHRQRYRQALVGALYPLILTLYLLILLLDLLQSLFNGHWSSPLSSHKRKIAACSDTEISPLALHPIGPVDRHPITAAFHRLQHHRPHLLRRAGDAPDPDLRCRNTTTGDRLDVECTGSGTELKQF